MRLPSPKTLHRIEFGAAVVAFCWLPSAYLLGIAGRIPSWIPWVSLAASGVLFTALLLLPRRDGQNGGQR